MHAVEQSRVDRPWRELVDMEVQRAPVHVLAVFHSARGRVMCRAAVAAMNVHCVASKVRPHFFGQIDDSHVHDTLAAVITLELLNREMLAEFRCHSFPTPFKKETRLLRLE